MRKKIFDVIEVLDPEEDDFIGQAYDWVMLAAIIISVIPLAFKTKYPVFEIIDKVTVTLFIIDYILRLITADYKMGEKNVKSFIRYPFTPMAIVDLLAIIPSFLPVNGALRLVKLFRLMRTLRVIRVFKAVRYSKNFSLIARVFESQKEALSAVLGIAVVYVLISALVIINVEPESFENYFAAVYWATVSLTTVGYGDIYPVTVVGRIVTMISAVFGIAVVALPAGLITASMMDEIRKVHEISDEKVKEA